MDDNLYAYIAEFKKNGSFPDTFASSKSNFVKLCRKYALNSKGVLLREGKIQVKQSERKQIFETCHDLKTHSGRDATWAKISSRYYWYGGEKYVREQIHDCVSRFHLIFAITFYFSEVTCNNKANINRKAPVAPLRPLTPPTLPFMRVHLDVLGPLPETALGNKYIVIAVCGFTKFVEARGN